MYTFSIVSYFPKEIAKEIVEIQKELTDITDSKGAWEVWEPHITVGSGVEVTGEQLEKLYEEIEAFLENVPVFHIETQTFSFMSDWTQGAKLGLSPFVVYIKPYNLGGLGEITTFFEENIASSYAVWYQQPLPYSPHITVAYKDLTEDGYEKAKEYLSGKTFEREIKIDNVCLAIQNEKGEWREYKRFSLKT